MWWETHRVSALSPLGALGWRGAARHCAGPSLHSDPTGRDSCDFQPHLRDKQYESGFVIQLIIISFYISKDLFIQRN